MARFENYQEDKIFWFVTYLQLAEVISKYPQYSVKNSSFKEDMEEYIRTAERERKIKYGFYSQK